MDENKFNALRRQSLKDEYKIARERLYVYINKFTFILIWFTSILL